MSVLQKNIQYIKSVMSNQNKDICVANAAVCVADAKNTIIDLINKKDDRITIKESGYLYEDKEAVANQETGTSDTHKIRIGYTTYGFSIVCGTKLWFILSKEELDEAVVKYKSKSANRYSNDFENYMPAILSGDRNAIIDAFAGVALYGAKDKDNDLFGVVDNMDRKEGVSSIYIETVGDKGVKISAVPAVTLTSIHAGMNYYLQVEIGLTISAIYADGKPVEQKAEKK